MEWLQTLGATMSGIVWVDKRYLWLVNDCLEYHQPIITTVNPPLSLPPLFRGGKLISPPLLSIKPHPLPLPSILHKQLTWTDQLWLIQAGNSYCFWSSAAWPPTSCICLTFSTIRSSSLWRILTIFLSLEKAVQRPGTTSPSGPPEKCLKRISPTPRRGA